MPYFIFSLKNNLFLFLDLYLYLKVNNQQVLYLRMWLEEKDKLRRNFIFKDFKEAFAFMAEIAAAAEKLNHHPE